MRKPPGKYRLLVLHSPGNREEFWYNSTFHKLKNSTRGRGSDDSGAAARRSNKATLQMSDKLYSLSRRYDKLKLIGHQTDPLLNLRYSSGILLME